jgi:PAS domain S-box-containing protein
VGSILLLDESHVLRYGASKQLSDFYCQQIDGLAPGPLVGSCGTAAFTGESVMVEDVFASPLWVDFVELAKKEGIRACWSEPIFSPTNRVIGTAAMYFREVCTPTEVDRELMKSLARMAGIAIERSLETKKLQRNELRFRSLVQSAAATVCTTDSNGEFVEHQESWENYTGQSWEEHRGFGWTEMIHPDDRDRLIETWKVAVEMLSSYRSYGRVWHAASGEYRHFEVQGVPVVVDGNVVEWSGCTIDVHDRKMAEKALQQNELQLRTIANSLPICIGQIDKEYRYRFCNARYETFYGKSVDEIQGRTVSEVFGESSFLQSKPKIDAAMQGTQIVFEQRHIGIDGVSRIGETRLVPNKNAEGAVIGVYVLTDDITQRRALEKEVLSVSVQQQLQMGQDLHDGIGQELTGLGMITDTMLLALSQSNSEHEFIAKKLADGIKRTLGQTKLLARGLNPVDVSPGGICSALLEMAIHVESLYGIKCVVDCAPEIEFDDDQISINLFRIAQEATTNAARHGRAEIVEINFCQIDDQIELSIVDDGCGIDLKNQTSRGMGLRTMAYRAGLIGAQLQITSNAGEGTSVRCQIPTDASMVFTHSSPENRSLLKTRLPNVNHTP